MFCREVIKWAGFEPIPGWECVFFDRSEQLFCRFIWATSRWAGKADALPKMWPKLNEKLKLDPATKMNKNLYLGCKQTNFTPPTELVLEQGKFVEELKGSTL